MIGPMEENRRSSTRKKIRNFLILHPRLNPFLQTRMGIGRRLTAFLRKDPNFMIIGAGKCGTTTLHRWLSEHPKIKSAFFKEIHYFDSYSTCGLDWYRAHFPLKSKFFTLDATANYLDHPAVPLRIKKVYPTMKFIIILRDPIERAFSHYNHTKRNGDEQLSFTEAIEKEDERLSGEIEKISEDPLYQGTNYNKYSYLYEGLYYEQFKLWFEHFDRDQFLILEFKKTFSNPKEALNKIYEFLGLEPYYDIDYSKYNVGKYEKINLVDNEKLLNFFKPYNEKLVKLLGPEFNFL